jgi:hypothetical protein
MLPALEEVCKRLDADCFDLPPRFGELAAARLLQ